MIDDQGGNLVFLLSLPRSGSTVLSLMLAGHSQIYCPPEPWFLLKLSSVNADGSTSSRFDDKLATKATNEFFAPLELDNCSRNFAVTAYNQRLKEHSKQIFVDKTPRYYHILEYIDGLFPHSKKIWLQRSPLDVAASYKTRWKVDIDTLTGKHPNFASLDFSLGLFKLAEYFKELSPSKMHVQYEQLVQTPDHILESICQFIGVPFEPEMLQFGSNKSTVDEFRKSSFGDKDAPNTTIVTSKAICQWSNVLSRVELQAIVNLLGMEVIKAFCTQKDVAKLLELGVQPPSESDAEAKRKAILNSHIDLVEELTRVADVRLHQLHEKEGEVRGLKKSVDERLAAVEAASRSLAEKEEEITATQKIAEERARALTEKEREIESTQGVAKERVQSLLEKEAEIAATQKVAAERAQALVEKEREIESTQGVAKERVQSLLEKEAEIAATQKAAAERAQALVEKEREIEATQKAARERAQALLEKEAEIASTQKVAEERANLLLEKERMIESLYEVAEERFRVIYLINQELETIKKHWIYRLGVRIKRLLGRT